MPSCSVLTCKNDSRTVNVAHGGVSYHRFPKEPTLKERWIAATGRVGWFPLMHSTICSKHFDPTDIQLTKKGYKYLVDTAVPTRNFLSFHERKQPAKNEANGKKSPEIKKSRPKVEYEPGPSRKRASDSSVESLPAKSSKQTESDDFDGSDISDSDNESTLSLEEERLKSMLRYEQNKITKQSITMKRLKKNLERVKKTVAAMDDIYNVLREKRILLLDDIILLRTIDVDVAELVTRRHVNKQLSEVVSKLTYSEELRTFALTLRILSAEAYDYVRKTFKTSLPHPRTLKHWYLKVNGEPGFTREAFMALKRKADATNEPIFATLSIGEMSLTRCVQVDKRIVGYVDMGTGLDTDMLDEARDVLVLFITAINGNFKVPVAYFLTCNLKKQQLAELVKLGLEMAYDAGIKIVAITFGDCSTYTNMANSLGCDLQNGKVTFNHPVNNEPIVALLHPTKIIDIVKDALRNFKTLTDEDGNKINWNYVKQLKDTIYLTKKLKDQSVDYLNARVQINLDADLFSPRVIETLHYCRNDLKLEAFKDSEATEKLFTFCNSVLNIFNLTNSYAALDKNNSDEIINFLTEAFENILKLKIENKYPLMQNPQRYKCSVVAIKELYKNLIDTNFMATLPLHKLSTDLLEMFFCNLKVEAQCGPNGDPTPKMIINGYKKIVELIKDVKKHNNPPLAQLSIPRLPSPVDRINLTAGQIKPQRDEQDNKSEIEEAIDDLSRSNEDAVVQIARFVVQQLMKRIRCDVCVEALVTTDRAMHHIIVAKDKSRLLYPSLDVIKVCSTAERYLKGFDGGTSRQNVKNEVMMAKIMRQFVNSAIFDGISVHQVGKFPESNHVTDLMKAVVERYARVHYFVRAKKETFKDVIVHLKEAWSRGGCLSPGVLAYTDIL